MGKVIKILLVVFVIWYVVRFPTQAGGLVSSAVGWLESAAKSGANFLSSL